MIAILGLRQWRPGPESNRCTGICSPLHSHSATGPKRDFLPAEGASYTSDAGKRSRRRAPRIVNSRG